MFGQRLYHNSLLKYIFYVFSIIPIYSVYCAYQLIVSFPFIRYIFSIDNVDDFNEFILGLVDGSDSINYSTLVSIFEQLQAMRSVKKSVSIMVSFLPQCCGQL